MIGQPPDPVAAAVRVLRVQASQLRRHSARLFAQADELEAQAAAAVGADVLRGRAIVAKLCELVRPGEELHYSALADRLRDAGYIASGVDPEASLLVSVYRSDEFEQVGSRTGIYRRRVEVPA